VIAAAAVGEDLPLDSDSRRGASFGP